MAFNFDFQLFTEPSKAKHFYDGGGWMLGEHIPDMDFYFAQIWLHSFTNEMEYSIGRNYAKVMSFHHGYNQKFYYGEKNCHEFCLAILDKLKKNPEFGEQTNDNIVKFSDKLVKHSKVLNRTDLKKLSNEQLWKLYWENIEIHLELYRWGWLPNAVDMFYPELTTYLTQELAKKVTDQSKLTEYFVKLTAADEETVATQEHRSLLKLVLLVQKENLGSLFVNQNEDLNAKISASVKKKFAEHCADFRHLTFMYHGTAQNVEFYYAQVSEYLKNGKNPIQELAEIDASLANAADQKKKLVAELKIDDGLQRLLAIYAKFMVTKWYRRNSQILCFYYIEPLLVEIGNRVGLSLQDVRVMLWEEVSDALLSKAKIDAKKLRDRFEFFCFYTEKSKRFVFTGELAKKLEQQASTVKLDANLKELHGQCACLGKVTGKVKIIMGPADSHKMMQGDILVSIATDPDIVPAMKKAAAIITEQGGVTSHAAIISRELGIPCVIGTKVATKWLKDGDVVEVDATNGIIRKINKGFTK